MVSEGTQFGHLSPAGTARERGRDARPIPVDAPAGGTDTSAAIPDGRSTMPAGAMRYVTITEVSPEDVLARARRFFGEHSRLRVREETEDSITFAGEIGLARFVVDRAGGHTNVEVETDRVVGLDVTDLAKRFLYTLRAHG